MTEIHSDPLTHRESRTRRVGLWSIAIGLFVVFVGALLAPLDEGVPTQALVALDTKRKTVQHPQGGVISEVLVREGEVVKQGDVLMRLSDTTARANTESIRQRYLGFRAMESRLLAEQGNRAAIVWHPDVRAHQHDPLIRQHMQVQEQLLMTRRAAVATELSVLEASIGSQQATRQSQSGLLESRKAQHAIVSEQWRNVRGLVADGYAPRTQQLELERQLAELSGAIVDLTGGISRTDAAVAELRQRMLARQQEVRREVDTQLAEITREVQSDQGRLQAANEDLARMEVRSPSDGQVVGLAFQTLGGVVPPGQRIMDIVPERESLIVEARIMPHLIASVAPGLLTDVRFSTFAHAPQLVAEGRVLSVSNDLLTEPTPAGTFAYYLVRIALTEQGIQQLGGRQLQAGMPAEVIIKTGERTLLTYLLHPLVRRVAAAMKEQ